MPSQIVGVARKYDRKAKFIVEVEGFLGPGRFQKCSEIAAEMGDTEHWEGGAMIPFKGPSGRVTVPDVTLDRGATSNKDLYNWFVQVANMAAETGMVDEEYKRNVAVVQLDLDGNELKRWNLWRAYPKRFKAGDWDNTSDEVVIEQMVLRYDYPSLA